jgi:type I restriction enzyme R subunit
VDIFNSAIASADISILGDKFLQTFQVLAAARLDLVLEQLFEQLETEVFVRSVFGEIQVIQGPTRRNAAKIPQATHRRGCRYQGHVADAPGLGGRGTACRELGLSSEELAFFEVVAANFGDLYDGAFLRDLIHDVVETIKKNLKVDWTEPHCEDVKAAVRSAVKRVLRRRNVR